MKMTSKLNKKAWKIRKNAAKKLNCKVMEISWKACLEIAAKPLVKRIWNNITGQAIRDIAISTARVRADKEYIRDYEDKNQNYRNWVACFNDNRKVFGY